jgi:hypothetical protein
MKNVAIKFYRSTPDSLESYGPLVIRRLDQLVGGSDKWSMTQYHGIATVPGTKIRIERHEDGPEFWNLVITQLPNYVSAIAGVASAWFAYKSIKRPQEQRTVKLRIGKHSYEGPVKSARDLRSIVAALKSLR